MKKCIVHHSSFPPIISSFPSNSLPCEMQNSGVIKLLKVLTKAEIKELKKYLKSPYLNKNRNCEKLFTILIQYYPDFSNPKVEAEKIYYRIFPKTTNYQKNASNFRTLMAALKKQIKQFLIYQELNQKSDQAQLLLLDAYSKRDIPNDLIHEVKNEILRQDQKTSSQYFLNRFQLYLKLYEKEAVDHFKPDNESFTHLNNNLDLFFTLTKLKLGIEHKSLLNRAVYEQPINFIKDVQAYIEINKSSIAVILSIYSDVFSLFHDPNLNVSKFFQTFSLLDQNHAYLEKKEIEEIVTILYNFSNRKIRKVILAPIYKRLRFEVIKFGVNHGIYLQKNIFPNGIFIMIVISAASAGQFGWAETFIGHNSRLLPEATRELDEAYIKGIHYSLKASKTKAKIDFEKSITAFKSLKDKNPKYNRAKTWNLLKCYYEFYIYCNDDGILSYMENYHVLVQRSISFGTDEKRNLLNTLNALKFLVKSRHHPNITLEKAQRRIIKIQEEAQFDKGWLDKLIQEFLSFRFPSNKGY